MHEAQPERCFVQGLAAPILALEAVRRAFQAEGAPGDAESARRLARVVRESATRYGCSPIADAAGRVEGCGPPELAAAMGRLLAEMRGAATPDRSGHVPILIVDADAAEARRLTTCLAAPGRRFELAGTLEEADRILEREEIALMILDPDLGSEDGRELLVRVRSQSRRFTLPIVILTAHRDTRDRVECFALGADEFIGKPYDPDSLAACVSAKLQRAGEISRWTWLDGLTALPNRASLRQSFERMRERVGRDTRPAGVALIDLDRLKWVNDTHGHAAGDEVLRAAAADLSAAMRESDLVGRWGGEEFLAVLPGAGESGAVRVMQKALAAFRSRVFKTGGGASFECTFSAGVVADSRDERMEEVIARADRALYLAKAAGRNTVHGGSRPEAPPRQALLVEDDEVMATVLAAFLQAEGFHVNRFGDAESALAAAEHMKCSFAVLDIRLPGSDGLEVLKSLRKLHGFSRVPVLMVTGVQGPREVVRAFSLGADDYVAKPFSPAELQARIHRLAREA